MGLVSMPIATWFFLGHSFSVAASHCCSASGKKKDKQHNEAIAQIPFAVSMRVIEIFRQLSLRRLDFALKFRARRMHAVKRFAIAVLLGTGYSFEKARHIQKIAIIAVNTLPSRVGISLDDLK